MTTATSPSRLVSSDDVLPELSEWRLAGKKCALVTLVGIDGAAPRPLGAQMAVAEDGRYAGYLSGGCLEQAVAQEALRVLGGGANRLVRYGKGSAYFDLKLPCGSGLDLYFDQSLDAACLDEALCLRGAREAFTLLTDLGSGQSTIRRADHGALPVCALEGNSFLRAYIPLPNVLLIGAGPAFTAIATLIEATGLGLSCVSPDDDARSELTSRAIPCRTLASAQAMQAEPLDRFTAAIIAFHDHHWEPAVLAHLLRTPAFYIGALGSRTAHANRLDKLAAMGFDGASLARVRGPVGSIPGAKSRTTLAVGVLAELVAQAKTIGLLA